MAQKRPAPTRLRFQQLDDDGPRPKRRKARPSLEVVGKGRQKFVLKIQITMAIINLCF